MNIEKSIATLEVTEDDKVIIRERIAVLEKGMVQKGREIEVNGELTHETYEEEGMVEKSYWFEQRTIKNGDDYSQECDKVKAVCIAVFADN